MFTTAFVIAGWAFALIICWRMQARGSARIRSEAQEQITSLSARVADLEQTIAFARALRAPEPARDAAVAAGVAALVSEKVVVRPVKKPTTLHPLGDPWAQQGRAGVQSSHDIAQRGH